MSIITEALRKAAEERTEKNQYDKVAASDYIVPLRQQSAEPLREIKAGQAGQRSRQKGRWILWAFPLLLVLLVGTAETLTVISPKWFSVYPGIRSLLPNDHSLIPASVDPPPMASALQELPAPHQVTPQLQSVAFRLTGISEVDGEQAAIINNRIVRVGDVIGHALITAIDRGGVALEEKGHAVYIQLEE